MGQFTFACSLVQVSRQGLEMTGFVLLAGCFPCRHSPALNKLLTAVYKRTGIIQLRVPGSGWFWYWWWSCSKWEVRLWMCRDPSHLMSLGSSFRMFSALCAVSRNPTTSLGCMGWNVIHFLCMFSAFSCLRYRSYALSSLDFLENGIC